MEEIKNIVDNYIGYEPEELYLKNYNEIRESMVRELTELFENFKIRAIKRDLK